MPMGPDSEKVKRSALCLSVRKMTTLHAAWQHVRASGHSSANEDIQKETRRFEENALMHLRTIHEALRRQKFTFSPQKGIAKKRARKTARPIVVAPIANRVVQRAILTVGQSIPAIEKILNIPTSFGGITGTDAAIALAIEKIRDGATWYIRSDIPSFFTRIPKLAILDYVRTSTLDEQYVQLFAAALAVELENAAALKQSDLYNIFPIGPIGVAQGSALSPLAGNILLREFDEGMNGLGITCIRYIDDFLILGPTKQKVTTAFRSAKRRLGGLGLDAYDPETHSDKAESGQCSHGIDFLGCRITDGSVIPGKKARRALLDKISRAYADGIQSIQKAIAGKNQGAISQRFAQSHTRVDRIVKGWGESFSFCNDRRPFTELDKQINGSIREFNGHVKRLIKSGDDLTMRRAIGITLLGDITSKPIGGSRVVRGLEKRRSPSI
ncbi:MAG: hypothetical protein HY059_00490 [Proteobacteria bacterium]|nr:hypothetical protein [Pseudomonadota bacterium]